MLTKSLSLAIQSRIQLGSNLSPSPDIPDGVLQFEDSENYLQFEDSEEYLVFETA